MKKLFPYGGRKIPYGISYSSRRKTIRISVDGEGQVNITAPAGLSEKEIIRRVKTRGDWILKKLDSIQMQPATVKKYVDGESVPGDGGGVHPETDSGTRG